MPRPIQLVTAVLGACGLILFFGAAHSEVNPTFTDADNNSSGDRTHDLRHNAVVPPPGSQKTLGWLPSNWYGNNEQQKVVQHVTDNVAADDDLYMSFHNGVPQTTLTSGIAGFNFFTNLYLFNGTFYFVTDDAEAAGFPAQGPGYIMSDVSGATKETAGPDRWQVITPAEAKQVLGRMAIRRHGVSHYFNDRDGGGSQAFLAHYYHFSAHFPVLFAFFSATIALDIAVGEMFIGLWRLSASAGSYELPARLVFLSEGAEWRDRARITPWFQRTIMAETVIEEHPDWEDRKLSGVTFVYDKIGIADRWAAHRHGTLEVKHWNKAIGDLPQLRVPLNWMDPLRDRVVQVSEVSGCTAKRAQPTVPVVTYIDRQKTARRLLPDCHEDLVKSLQALHDNGDIEFVHAQMEFIERTEQFCLAARTDIMVGVHGNGLSHQLWMKPGSGVLEIMMPDSFLRDYSILAELMSHEYYAVHNDTYLPRDKWRRPDGWGIGANDDFHSSKIPANGPWIANLVKDMAARRRYGPTPVQW
ncbi:uncharacterized protein EHS24_000364 [Apiotrichum porosum]|uniref:Glycosyltransferase 61 catalytic domain-containing protein n=1 Tax=Apiotrichum porosum TaxID=105984 RepID=A0A427Y9T7_9TREE|nr:uncharacterized protein EHS24_000364 [Apiotrichum porosum]RSH87846.1 hypothetical protein EHS24_000364 [Apiotrichum porosum]